MTPELLAWMNKVTEALCLSTAQRYPDIRDALDRAMREMEAEHAITAKIVARLKVAGFTIYPKSDAP